MMKTLVFLLAAVSAFVQTPLEWNVTYRTDVPYEFAVNPAKLGMQSAEHLQIFADGKPVRTIFLQDEYAQLPVLRFAVPAGTKTLSLASGMTEKAKSGETDNFFVDPVWKAGKLAVVENLPEGVLVRAKDFGNCTATCRISVPDECKGKPVALEFDCSSAAKMMYPCKMYFAQYDKDGRRLPEYVSDGRWTTHFRPVGVLTPFREKGRIHPQAASVELNIIMTGQEQKYDEYGIELKNREDALPSLLVSHISMRPAAELPFPKYRDAFFGKGVSEKDGDCSISLDPERTFWFCTRSSASWAGRVQIREESQCFYPAGAGTVEAWFKPDWKRSPKDAVLFQAVNNMSIVRKFTHGKIKSMGAVLQVVYNDEKGSLDYSLMDVEGKKWSGKVDVRIPDGKWFHLAVTLQPDDAACLFLDGKKILSFPINYYKGVDLKESDFPNDDHAIEFYLGSDYKYSRCEYEKDRLARKHTFYSGEADLLRISTGVRYTSDFVPAKSFVKDADTRALFSFDRSYDGWSGGGEGWISGTLLAMQDRIDHKLGDIQYYPDELPDALNPDVQLHKWNTIVPDENDFAKSEKTTFLSFEMKPGEEKSIQAPAGVSTDYVEIANTGNSVLRYPAVVRKGDVDVRSYGDIRETLFDGTESNFEKANKVFNLLLTSSDYFASHQATFDPGSDVPRNVERDQLGLLNAYCGFECGPLNSLAATLFSTVAMFPANWTGGYGHSFEQVYFDGKNHTYDLSAQRYFPMMNNELPATLGEMEEQPRVNRRWGAGPNHFIRAGSRAFSNENANYPEKYSFCLNPGEKVRFYWYNNGQNNDLWNVPEFRFAHKLPYHVLDYTEITGAVKDKKGVGVYRVDRFFPEYANAFIEFDGKPTADNSAFVNVTDESFCYNVFMSYPIVAAKYSATNRKGKQVRLEISTDGGKTFRPFTSPATYQVRARRAYLIRVCAPISEIKNFKASTEFETNSRMLLGGLKEGENLLTFKAAEGEKATISYKYHTPAKDIVFEGALNFGTYKGYTHDLLVFDPAKPLNVKVEGLSPSGVKIGCKGGVNATLTRGMLKITAADKTPHFAYVTVTDGDASKTLTLLVCSGIRYIDIDRQIGKGDEAEVTFDPLPEGKYAVLTLGRCTVDNGALRNRIVDFKLGKSKSNRAAGNINDGCDLFKKIFGEEGQKGRWKFDYPFDPKSKYNTRQLLFMPVAEGTDNIRYNGRGKPADIKGAILIPETTHDFKCEFLTKLCSTISRPWAIDE